MKNRLFILSILLLFSSVEVFSQTKSERKKIIETYDIAKIKQLGEKFKSDYIVEKEKINFLAKKNNWILKKEENGNIIELVGVDQDEKPIYYTTYNSNAAISTRTSNLHNGGDLGLNLEGQNMTVYIWDVGLARITHQEYDGIGGNNRYSVGDNSTDLSSHGAHVAGTIMASGVQLNAKGMAPQCSVVGFDWSNALFEASTAASNGMLLSNHSYGRVATSLSDYFFGSYSSTSREWDSLMYIAPYYLMVVSAGNDGLDITSNGTPLENNPNYDKLSDEKTAKNNLVVANANDAVIDGNGNLISVQINPTSSQGPTDDYRIKPDITGNGTELYSTIITSDDSYGIKTGTSMSAPNVTGTLLLLQQHYNDLNINFMKAATLKGLVLHTADDAGIIGPDAIFGWGLLNAKKAVNTITNNGTISIIDEITLRQGQTYQITVEADGVNDLIASISWTDPEGRVRYGINNTTPCLVNDLDLRIEKNTIIFKPYKLTSASTNTTGDNIVDPYEKVIVPSASGLYTITITHKGELTNEIQNFSLIVTGKVENNNCIALSPTIFNVFGITNNEASVSWSTVENVDNYELRYKEINSSTWLYDSFTDVFGTITGLTVAADYEVQIKSKCADNSNSPYSPSFYFTTTSLGYCPPSISVGYTDDFENERPPEVDSCWTLLGGDNNITSQDSYYYGKSILINHTNLDTNENVLLVSPYLNDFNANKRISIKSNKSITIGTISDINDINSFVPYQTFNNNGDDLYNAPLTEIHFDFANYLGNDNHIGIRYENQYSRATIDDFSYENSPNCIEPKNLFETGITSTSINLNWTNESGAVQWLIEYGIGDFVFGTGTQLTVNSNSYLLDNLEPNTNYKIYVKTICGSQESEWSPPKKIRTACGMIAPYSNTFDTDEEKSDFNRCWTNIDGSYSIVTGTSLNHKLRLAAHTKLISPKVLDFDSNKRIHFWLSTSNSSDLVIGTMSDPTDINTYTSYTTISATDIDVQDKYFIIDFKNYSGTDKYMVIENTGSSYGYFYINDFVYEETPNCIEVANIQANALSETEIELAWDELGTATEWEIEYGEIGFVPGNGTLITSNTNPTTIADLNHSAFYDFYMRAKCNANESSNWLPYAITARTDCGTQSASYTEDFNSNNLIEDTCWISKVDSNAQLNFSSESIEANGKSCKLVNSQQNNVMLISPILNGINTANKRIKFWLKKGSSYNSSEIEFGTTSDINSFTNVNIIETIKFKNIKQIWTQYSINLDDYSNLGERFYIKVKEGSTSNLYFDRFEFEEIPICITPDLSIGSYQNYNLTLSWEDYNGVSSWELAYSNNGSIYDATIIQVDSNSYTFNNLSNYGTYKFWVRSICNVNEKSDFSEAIVIRSGCGESFELGYTQDFNNSIPCWSLYEFPYNSSSSYTGISNEDVNNNGKSIALASSSNYSGGLLISPIFNDIGTNRKIKFFIKSYGNSPIAIGTITNPSDYRTFTKLEDVSVPDDGVWHEKTVYLNHYNSNDRYIAFSAFGYDRSVRIDNFSFEESIPCGDIPNISITSISENSIEMNWEQGVNDIGWEYEYRLLYNYGAGTLINTTTNLNTISGLIGNTDYEVRARAYCDTGLYTYWTDYIPFTTPCEDVNSPYFYSFEDNPLYPCWNTITTSAYDSVKVKQSDFNVTAASGESYIHFAPWSGYNPLYLITPSLSDLNNSKRIRLKAIIQTKEPYNDIPYNNSKLHIGTMSNPNDASTFNLLETLEFERTNDISYSNVGEVQWKEFTIYLNGYTGTDKYIAIKNDNLDGRSYFYVDDFYYEDIPVCTEPLYAQTTNITFDSATITWQNYENSGAVSWDVEYGIEGFTIGEGTLLINNLSSFNLENLESDTHYEYYLRSNCGSEYSNWSTKFSFKTECAGVNVGYFENFDNISTGNLENCWTEVYPIIGIPYWDRNRYINVVDTSDSYTYEAHSSPNSVKLFNETNHEIFHDEISDRIILVSPRLINFNNYKRISFWMKAIPRSNASPKEIVVGTLSDPYDYSTFTNYYTITSAVQNEGQWIKYEIDFSDYNLTDEYIGIKQASINERQTILIDDFEYIEEGCNTPTNLLAYQTSNSEITFSWQDNNTTTPPLTWEIEYGLEGFALGTGTTVTANSNPFSISNLNERNVYDYYVRAQCQSGFGNWSNKYSFYVSCSATTPLTENFDQLDPTQDYTYGNNNYCWLMTDYNTTEVKNFTSYTTVYNNSAPNNLQIAYYGDYNPDISSNPGLLVSPFLEDFDNTKILQFWLKTYSYTYSSGIIVGTMKNPIDRSTFTPFKHILHAEMDEFGHEYIIDFSTYTGSDKFIAIMHDGENTLDYFSIDDINYRDHRNCVTAYNINEKKITSSMVTISWDSYGISENYEIELTEDWSDDPNIVTQTTQNNEITFTGLLPESTYSYYIRTHCTSVENSGWIGPFDFTTRTVPISLPWFEGFENLTTLGFYTFPHGFFRNQFMHSTNEIHNNSSSTKYPMWAYEGDNYVAGDPDNDLWLITPQFNLIAGETYSFDFKYLYKQYNYAANFDTLEIFCIYGHRPSDIKYKLNEVEGLFNQYSNPNYSSATQTFTPQISGEYSFGIFVGGSGDTLGPEEVCIDNFSVNQSSVTTITNSISVDFTDETFGRFGINNNENSIIRIQDELVFASKGSVNWVSTTNSDPWESNQSYISTLEIDVDATVIPLVNLSFDLQQKYYQNSNDSQFRVLINDVQYGDVYFANSNSNDVFQHVVLNLATYNNQNYTIKLQFLGKHSMYETLNNIGDEAHIDNLKIEENTNLNTNEELFKNLQYYPNPTSEKFYIKSDSRINKIEIFSLLGQEIFSNEYDSNNIILNLENYDDSIYFISIYINDKKKTIKITKN